MNGQAFHNQNTHLLGKAAAFGLLLSLLFWVAACEKGEADVEVSESGYATLVISLGSIDNTSSVTRAGEEEEFPYERKIEKCWVVLFDSEDNWFMTVTTDKFTINNNDKDSRSEAAVDVPVGTYTGYAFANLNNLDNGATLTAALERGKQLDETNNLTIEYLNNLAVSLGTNASVFKDTDGGKAIPMSSYAKENITVRENVTNSVEIGMFRMLGKVTITVTNQLSSPLSLQSLSMGNFRKGDIFFIPYKEKNITLDDILNGTAQELQPQFPNSGSLYMQAVVDKENPSGSITSSEPKVFSFYAFETNHQSDKIQVNIQVDDRDEVTKDTDFSFMRRNDWLKIPIYVTDMETRLWFENTRMPIGGLPYQVKYGDKDGIQILAGSAVYEVDPDYAGPVKVSFELKNIEGVTGGLNIIYPSDPGNNSCSKAIITDNTDKLLINKETGMPVEVEEGSGSKITLTPGEQGTNGNITTGSFEVWTQELGSKSEAIIELTLVVKYGEDTKEIPYTIRIQNYKKSSSSTGEGGN